MILWFNGALMEDSQAQVSVLGAGVLLGWGVFSTIGVRDVKPIAASRHFARLRRDAEKLEIEFPFEDAALFNGLIEVIARNGIENGIARVTVTRRGDGRWNHAGGSDCFMVAHTTPPAKLSNLRVVLSPYRLDARRALAGVKSTSYMEQQLAWMEAQKRGFDEAIICNQSGAFCEGARSNLFWVQGGELFTPSLACGCLPGIGRELMMEAAAQLGVVVKEGAFSLQELFGADEVFITSATNGPRSIAEFHMGEEHEEYLSPGPLTHRLQQWWSENLDMLLG